MQNSPPPTSSGKVKFHANTILLLFNYQPVPGRWSSPDRFSFVGLHKAREAGLGESWLRVPHGAELWQPLARTSGRAGEGTGARAAPGTARNAPAPAGCTRK